MSKYIIDKNEQKKIVWLKQKYEFLSESENICKINLDFNTQFTNFRQNLSRVI